MKIAILVVGELREVQKIKNAYDKCDVFVHTDTGTHARTAPPAPRTPRNKMKRERERARAPPG